MQLLSLSIPAHVGYNLGWLYQGIPWLYLCAGVNTLSIQLLSYLAMPTNISLRCQSQNFNIIIIFGAI